jgi:hypothetical protein
VDRPRPELFAPLVRHPHDRSVDVEHFHHGARESRERLVEAKALREGPGNLVQRTHPSRRSPLGGEGRLPLLPEPSRLLVELSVLDGDRELPGKRGQQRRFVLACRPSTRRVRGKEPHDIAPSHERNRQRRADSGLPGRSARQRESRVAYNVGDLQHPPVGRRAEGDVEQLVCDSRVRAGEAAAHGFLELHVVGATEVDRNTLDTEEVGDALNGGLERVRDGELGRRLRDHFEHCSRALELERETPRPLSRTKRVSRAHAERRQHRELFRVRLFLSGMKELQDADRRTPERECRRDGAVLGQPRSVRAHRARPAERAQRGLTRRAEIGAGFEAPRGARDEIAFATLPEDRGRRTGHPGRQPHDFRRRILLVQRNRERLAGQLERRAHE